MLGDNKGIHELFEFVCSFSTAYYFCRLCKVHRSNLKEMTVENEDLVRNEVNYNLDISMKDPKLTGVKQATVFSKILPFNVITDSCVDPMNDIPEGIVNYGMSGIVKSFLQDTLQFSNSIHSYEI